MAGVPMALGPTGSPGTIGVLPAPGGVYLYESPQPGVIVYQLRRMQVVPVPVRRGVRFKVPEFRLEPIPKPVVVTTVAVGLGLIIVMILLAPVGV
jgi:hypothetical protein